MAAATGDLTETYRGDVAAWQCDVMGHLNIAHYFDRFADAAANLIEVLVPGVPAGATWRSTTLFVRYERELRAGDGLFIRSGVIGKDGDALRLGHALYRSGNDEAATIVEHRLTPRDLPYGALAEQRRVLAEAAVPWSAAPFEDIALPDGAKLAIASGRDRVKAGEVDERGELSLAGHVQRFAGAVAHIAQAIGMTADYMREHRRGFSTFETRLLLLSPPPGAGDGLMLKSGFLAVGKSSLRLLHELRYARSGDVVARMLQSGVHFDLETRRSAPLPAELADKAKALVIT